MSGTITLYNKSGVRLSQFRYAGLAHRYGILTYWQNHFGERYKKYYYQIAPDVEVEPLVLYLNEKLLPS